MVQKALVDPSVTGQLGMERRCPHGALADEYRVAVVAGEDLDGRAGPLEERRADEDAGERVSAELGDVEGRLEALELGAVAVAAHGDVEGTEAGLVGAPIEHRGGEQDRAGARAEDGETVVEAGGQRGEQTGADEQLADGRGFAAGQDQRVEWVERRGGADLDGVDTERVEQLTMLAERTLERDHTDFHGL